MNRESKSHHATNDMRRKSLSSSVAHKSNGSEHSAANTLRQRVGNQGTQRMMRAIGRESKGSERTRPSTIQTNLSISQPSDVREREADRAVNTVMSMSSATCCSSCAGGSSCDDGPPDKLARKAVSHARVADPLTVSLSTGRPLDSAARRTKEQ